MIEKILKTVKSSSKKRGKNITIGAVVGMLLSCSAVIKADDYLWLKYDNGIKFSKDNGAGWKDENPYTENNWNGTTYTNNIRLYGKNNDSSTDGYGLKLDTSIIRINLVNNGIINGDSDGSVSGTGIGINIGSNLTVGELGNNGIINGSVSVSGYGDFFVTGIGLKIDSNSTVGELGNNGIIYGSGYGSVSGYGDISGTGIGLKIDSNSIVGELGNNGIINGDGYGNGSGDVSGIGIGLKIESNSAVGELKNTGIIYGYGDVAVSGSGSVSGIGLKIDSNSTVGELRNNGIIYGYGHGSGYGDFFVTGIGLKIESNSTVGELGNNGIIYGYASVSGDVSISITGIGLKIESNSTAENIINNGVIYGDANAVSNLGTISNGANYGLLISKNSSGDVVGGLEIVDEKNKGINKIANYGLAFNFTGSGYKTKDEYHNNFGAIPKIMTIDGKNYTIVNVEAVVGDPSGDIREITSWKNLGMKNGELYSDAEDTTGSGDITTSSLSEGYILNGIEDTLKVAGTGNELNNSIINAYTTAVNMGAGSNLTLGNTVINGGTDRSSPVVSMAEDNSILSIEKNSKINGNISSSGENNIITISESIINGDISATKDKNNTLNLKGNRDEKRVVMYNNTMNVFHEVSGFANINIENNVAFYEDAEIRNVGNINIEKDGILVLRIKPTTISSGKIVGHALYTSSGTTTISSKGGKLLLALNGAGNTDIISFGTNKLDDSMFGAENSSIEYQEDFTIDTTSFLHSVEKIDSSNVKIVAQSNLPMFSSIYEYDKLNGIYRGIISVDELGNFAVNTPENLSAFLEHLNDIYAGSPYSYSSELSRKSAGMFRDIVTDNQFKPNLNNWLIYGGLTHTDGGNKDTYYGQNYYLYDTGNSNIDADTKITGAYMLGEYGVSDTLTSGVIIGGNKLKSDISNGSKVDGSALYLGAYAKKYIGNLKVTGGLGFQYGDYDADRLGVNRVASSIAEPVMKYSDNYNDMTYDIYLNGRYSHQIGDDLFLEPYATLSYTYIKQDGADEGSKTLAIEADSKSFDYVAGKIGVDLKKVISHEKGKSTLSAGVSYTKILDGADEEYITGRFKGGSDFDILVAHKNEHSIGLNAKYALELENGILFDIKGTYSVERDSHNNSGKNRTKGEWIAGAGLGYKF